MTLCTSIPGWYPSLLPVWKIVSPDHYLLITFQTSHWLSSSRHPIWLFFASKDAILTRNSISYGRDSARCVKRPFKVTQGRPLLCQSMRLRIYDFLLALLSNLTSIFDHSWDITPSLHIHTSVPTSKWNWKRTEGSNWTCLGIRLPRALDYPNINLNPW